jgi:hypothetical protein
MHEFRKVLDSMMDENRKDRKGFLRNEHMMTSLLLNVVWIDSKLISRMVMDLPKMNERADKRMFMVSKILNEEWNDVGAPSMKFGRL